MCDIENEDTVITVCYGETKVWNDREKARKHFLEAMMNSEGAERERYTNVYFGILRGDAKCSDTGE